MFFFWKTAKVIFQHCWESVLIGFLHFFHDPILQNWVWIYIYIHRNTTTVDQLLKQLYQIYKIYSPCNTFKGGVLFMLVHFAQLLFLHLAQPYYLVSCLLYPIVNTAFFWMCYILVLLHFKSCQIGVYFDWNKIQNIFFCS